MQTTGTEPCKPMVPVFIEIFQVGMVEHTNNHNSPEAEMEDRRLEFSLCCIYTKIFFQI